MTSIWERLVVGFQQLATVVPSVLFSLAILIVGYLLARLVERWTDAILVRLNFNKMADAGGLSEAVGRTGIRLDPIHAVGKLLFWLVMLVVILLASSALGLGIDEMFSRMLSYIPTLFASVVIVIIGMIVGEFVRGIVLASAGAVEGVPTLAKAAKAAVVLISVFMAMQQMGVAPEIITAAFTLIVGAIGLAAGLAFGLGNKDLAGEITRRWYEEGRQRRLGGQRGSQPSDESSGPTEPNSTEHP